MAKKQTFADKAKKKSMAKTCPICGSEIEYILLVKAEERADGRGCKFRHEQMGLCKCTEKEIFA